ncbi:MAG TPA: M20/M25/M40 family metallo-hydrolase, partial [Candidatus Eisenbacteria bacterium]
MKLPGMRLRTIRPAFALGLLVSLAAVACGDSGKETDMSSGPALDPALLLPRVEARLAAIEPTMIEVRHDIHRHPELSGQESRTAGLVADRLREAGFDVRTGVGGHGVVARLTAPRPGRSVGVRADMDAVRSNAHDPADFRSETPGVRHICGHDIHTTTALAAALALAAVQTDLAGSVVFYFQPAEENVTGAWAMLH